MRAVKEAVKYFVDVTGRDFSDFFSMITDAMSGSLDEQTGDIWLVHALVNKLVSIGEDVENVKAGKDAVKAIFDDDSRKSNGEFFTPVYLAEELHRYIDKFVPDWRENYAVYDGSAGVGNLVRTANCRNLFLSTLQEDDVTQLKVEFPNAEVFQLDFLSGVDDYGRFEGFTGQLPDSLQNVIHNDKPLLFIMNPPYRGWSSNATVVGRHMQGADPFYDNVDFARPSYDLFYQFCFQVMNTVAQFELKNCYFAVIGPLVFFTGSGANVLLSEFEKVFEFMDGCCVGPECFDGLQEFTGIGMTVWKSRGGYSPFGSNYNYHKDILLDKKVKDLSGALVSDGKVLYSATRKKLSTWVAAKDTSQGYVTAPLLTSHSTFKGSNQYEKVSNLSGKMLRNALGVMMTGNRLVRRMGRMALLSLPTTVEYASVTEENFWRCLASFVIRQVLVDEWTISKKELSEPDTSVEGYEVWLRNSIVPFLFEYKSLSSSMRNVSWGGVDNYCFHNRFFYLSENEIRQNCTDPVILQDLVDYPLENQFILDRIEESKQYWIDSVWELWNWCVGYTLGTYDYRASVGYKHNLECADVGFHQLRASLWDEKYDVELQRLISNVRADLSYGVERFGFLLGVGGDL